jgi:hypothetical protein
MKKLIVRVGMIELLENSLVRRNLRALPFLGFNFNYYKGGNPAPGFGLWLPTVGFVCRIDLGERRSKACLFVFASMTAITTLDSNFS